MEYFKVGTHDYSDIVNELRVEKAFNYNAQTNANGDTIVDLINAKREIEVGVIPLDEAQASALLNDIDAFNVSISFRNPRTQALEENVNCIINSDETEYYTIQVGNVRLKAFSLTFTEL